MSKFLKNFEIDRLNDSDTVERIKRKPQTNTSRKKSKSNKPKRGKTENWD